MTDLDKAREEWENRRLSIVRNDYSSDSYPAQAVSAADVLIAALEAEVERVNRIVVSQSQQLGNTRSQREHELIEALDSTQADADTQFKLRAQAEAERALRDRMIRISFEDAYPMHGDTYDSGGIYRKWLADLRARAEQNPQHLSTSSDVSITPLHNLKGERDELLAEVEALKCCGNCIHGSLEDTHFMCCRKNDDSVPADWWGDVHADDPCHFTPSRWQRRES